MVKKSSDKKPLSLYQLLLSQKLYLTLGLIGLIINKAATVAIPYVGKKLIDDVILNHDIALLYNIIIVILFAIILQTIASYFTLYVLGIRTQRLIAEMRSDFYQKISGLPIQFFSSQSSGSIVSRIIKDFESIRVYIGTGFTQLVGGIMTIIFAIILMLLISLKLTLILLIPLLTFGIITFFIFRKMKPSFVKKKKTEAALSGRLTESFRGIRVIKIFNAQTYDGSLIKNQFYQLYEDVKQVLLSTNLVISLATLFLGITSLILIWFGSRMILTNEITLGDFLSLTLYLGLLVAPALQISRISSQIVDASSGIDRINEIYNLEDENSEGDEKIDSVTGNIQLKDVSFSYENDTREVLKNVTLSILPGKVTAIVGKSGAGKSTLMDLVTGILNPTKGTVFVEGKNLDDIDLTSFRNHIGAVFQETLLFDGSIKENILLGKPEATETELEEAVSNAQLKNFVSQLNHGLDTLIGENGILLSEGEKQRICIARAFLANPKILLLDEATSNLDVHNEKLITESINLLMKNRTVIVIAHRLSTVERADQIVFMENGQLMEIGTHKSLLSLQGHYYNLYHSF